ncbi:hypothetical protein D3C85_1502200 [compost metagenome]
MQLGQVEGFGQVVVGAVAQAADALLLGAAGGEHDHRGLPLLAQAPQHGEAAGVRQHHVQQQQVRLLGQGQLQALFAPLADADGIALPPQQFAELAAQGEVVFDDENAGQAGDHAVESFGLASTKDNNSQVDR